LERENVVIAPEQLARQRQIEQELRAHLAQTLPHTPLAFVDTFGCQQNNADSEQLKGMLQNMGFSFTREASAADVIVLNTCAVREHAEQRVYGNLGALTHSKAKNPRQVICVCGCMAQQKRVADKIRQSYRHVDLVFGPHALWRFPELLQRVYQEHGRVFSIEESHGSIAEGVPLAREAGVKAWVSVMYGCNNFCSYCIVPHVRGRERSRDRAHIVEDVRTLVTEGYRDITLLGQNVNSYGKDLPDGVDFADLLSELSGIEGDFLLRFMTSHPRDASHKLLDTMARCDKVAKHLHLPFQSGSDRVLQAMNRHYDRATYLDLVRYARAVMPEIVLTSDVIVGFPGETEKEFEETLSLVQEVEFDALFTFIYSPRPGTPAAELPDEISRAEKQRWFDRLLDTQNEISAKKHAAYVGKSYRVLVDGKSGDERWPLSARTDGGRLVHLTGDEGAIGTFQTARILDSNTWALFGTLEA
jgi:tRNA-2-methylthio-N6-dimethylallyladenosine synthase